MSENGFHAAKKPDNRFRQLSLSEPGVRRRFPMFLIMNFQTRSNISHDKYLTVSVRMLFRECSCKNAGVAGYAEAFTTVLSGKQTSET